MKNRLCKQRLSIYTYIHHAKVLCYSVQGACAYDVPPRTALAACIPLGLNCAMYINLIQSIVTNFLSADRHPCVGDRVRTANPSSRETCWMYAWDHRNVLLSIIFSPRGHGSAENVHTSSALSVTSEPPRWPSG